MPRSGRSVERVSVSRPVSALGPASVLVLEPELEPEPALALEPESVSAMV